MQNSTYFWKYIQTFVILKRLLEIGAPGNLLLLNGTNSDSGKTTRTAAFDGISEFQTDSKVLHPVISELRVIKTEEELKVLRYVSAVSSDAHMQVMRGIKPGMKFVHYSKNLQLRISLHQ